MSSTSAWLGVNEPAPAPLGGACFWRAAASDFLPAQWMEQLLILEPEERLDAAWELSSKLAQDPAFAAEQRASFEEVGIGLNFTEQMQWAKTLAPRGTARGYAQVMAKVLTKEPGEAWAELMTGRSTGRFWRSAQLRETYLHYGTKGGSLPGVLTASYFAGPKDGEPRVLSLFFQDVPLALWAQLMREFTQQELERHPRGTEPFAGSLVHSDSQSNMPWR